MRLSYRMRFRRDHAWARGHMSEYLDAELTQAERSRLERHTRDCPECTRILAGLRALVEGLSRLPALGGGSGAAQIAVAVRARLDEPPPPAH
ncbi:MAG: anti-sigma factor family protein [Solirubrobacteraceae bacterium]